ncbi:MAG: hypothetical protein HYU86_10680 [Chloroflexi bacterium]|nr:hypothetical protein [Chloroflexota bacterium]
MVTGLVGRDLISINDFTNEEVECLFHLADEMRLALRQGKQLELCRGRDMATLFYEPSTRTRGSFERAMHKLGGNVVSFAEAKTTSSAAKGETIADTVRVLEHYADIIVIRHPWAGAAQVAADYARVPVINAGDGSHEHPTQTLCDLYTLRKEKGRIKGLTVVLWGDLKHGRTVHSLVYALVRFGAQPLCCTEPDLYPPEALVERLRTDYDHVLKKIEPRDLSSLIGRGDTDALYIAPFRPFQLRLPDLGLSVPIGDTTGWSKAKKVDAVYVTRLQRERMRTMDNGQAKYLALNDGFWEEIKRKKRTLIMHPLPRVDELPYQIDTYPRSVYFEQAANGVPIRMALTALLLGAREMEVSKTRKGTLLYEKAENRCKAAFGVECSNQSCVSRQESERRYIVSAFNILKREPLVVSCIYCDSEAYPQYFASSEWHQGTLENKRYYPAHSFMKARIRAENLVLFGSEEEAQRRGFHPSKHVAQGA